MIDKILDIFYTEEDEPRKKNWAILIVVSFVVVVLLTMFTIHTVDQAIHAAEPVKIELDTDTRISYEVQILDYIQYDTSEKLTWYDVYEVRDEKHVHISDGYTMHIFVFEDDVLTRFGTHAHSDLVPVSELD